MDSIFSYVGGKSLLTDKIIPLIPKHKCYVEPFAGAAWLLFRKEPSKIEIINDINSDLVNFYRCVRNHLDEVIRYMRWLVTARDEWDRFKKEDVATLTDIQRAVRFYFLLKNSFSAKLDFCSWRVSATTMPTFNILRLEEQFSAAHIRLARVYIENRPYEQVITHFDKPETFYYIDPPYAGCEEVYGKGIFSKEDFTTLKDLLLALKGRFIMSINDIPAIRQTYHAFHIRPVTTTYSISASGPKTGKELLISNF